MPAPPAFAADLQAFQSRAVDGSGYASRVYATTRHHGLRHDSRAHCCRPAAISTWRSTATAGSPCRARTASEAYTRAGDLRVDANGQLRTGTGLAVLGDGGPITVPPYIIDLLIGGDGTISIVPPGQTPETTRRRSVASSW